MIPKIIKHDTELPEKMTEEELDKRLKHNLLAMARVLAGSEKDSSTQSKSEDNK